MKYIFIIFCSQILLITQIYSQIGVNTENPQQLLHIDALRNTVNNTNTTDDIVVTNTGLVGIGTITPYESLTVNGDFRVGIDKDNMGEGNRFHFRGNDENTNPIWIARYNERSDITHIRFNIGYDSANNAGKIGRLVIGTSMPNSDEFKSMYVIQSDGNVGVNVVNPRYTLDVDGGLRAERGLTVPIANGADYVFDKDYKLTPLSEIKTKTYSTKQSEDCLNENGEIILDKISILYLKKIEELVLYKIELDDMIKSLKQELEEQENTIKGL